MNGAQSQTERRPPFLNDVEQSPKGLQASVGDGLGRSRKSDLRLDFASHFATVTWSCQWPGPGAGVANRESDESSRKRYAGMAKRLGREDLGGLLPCPL